MNKKEIIKTLDIASFISAVIATVLVIVFEFTGKYLSMKYAIVMYTVCFLTLTILFALNVRTVFSKPKQEENSADKSNIENVDENVERDMLNNDISNQETTTEELSESNLKNEKIKSIVWLSISSVLLIFTMILLILY